MRVPCMYTILIIIITPTSPKKKHLEKWAFYIIHRFSYTAYEYYGFSTAFIKAYTEYNLQVTPSKNILQYINTF